MRSRQALLFTILTIVSAIEIGCGGIYQRATYSTEAVYRIPGSSFEIILDRRQNHLFLAEYERTIVFRDNGQEIARQKAADDTGGYSRMNIYKTAQEKYYLRGDISFDRFIMDIETKSISEADLDTEPIRTEFIGAFDRDERKVWRFIPATERVEQKSRI